MLRKLTIVTAFTVAFLGSTNSVRSQASAPDFGIFNAAEISMKQCDFDKDADAVVLLDKGNSTYTENYNLRTERRIRLKILKERGIERGNIRIRYYSGDDFESISSVDATVVNVDNQGTQTRNTLERKSVFTKKLNKYWSEVSFALPNVKVGSLIEYKYVSEMKHYGGLKEWTFQKEIPVLLSSYFLVLLPNSEFAYSVYKVSNLPIKVIPDKTNGAVTFEMQNIAGLREEAYMGSANDYLQRVKFQFAGSNEVRNSGYGNAVTNRTNYTNTWKQFARELSEDADFGGQLNRNLSGAELLQQGWAVHTDPFVRMKKIHNYVKSTFNWDYIYSKYAIEGSKNSWEKKSGSTGDVNLILINLLKSAGLAVQPLLVSERDHGKIDTSYPYMDQFNKVVAYVTIGDKHYILDGTDKQTPSDIIPFDLLNTIGFIVDKKSSGLVKITDAMRKNTNLVQVTGVVNNLGQVKLDATVDEFDYAKIENKGKWERNKKNYEREFFEPYKLPVPDTFVVAGLESDSLPMHHDTRVNYTMSKTGDYYLLNYNLFTGFNKNPFINENRFTDINFGCPQNTVFSGTFNLPDNLTPEALPKSLKMITPDKSMLMVREVKQNGNTMKIDVRISINKTEFAAEDYPDVQSFYKQMIDLLNEPIVLKAKA
jgi:hypothetical protein